MRRIGFSNFKAFQSEVDFDFGLSKLNLLIGANNSGKSTIFKAINFLKAYFASNRIIDFAFKGDDFATYYFQDFKHWNNSQKVPVKFRFWHPYGWYELCFSYLNSSSIKLTNINLYNHNKEQVFNFTVKVQSRKQQLFSLEGNMWPNFSNFDDDCNKFLKHKDKMLVRLNKKGARFTESGSVRRYLSAIERKTEGRIPMPIKTLLVETFRGARHHLLKPSSIRYDFLKYSTLFFKIKKIKQIEDVVTNSQTVVSALDLDHNLTKEEWKDIHVQLLEIEKEVIKEVQSYIDRHSVRLKFYGENLARTNYLAKQNKGFSRVLNQEAIDYAQIYKKMNEYFSNAQSGTIFYTYKNKKKATNFSWELSITSNIKKYIDEKINGQLHYGLFASYDNFKKIFRDITFIPIERSRNDKIYWDKLLGSIYGHLERMDEYGIASKDSTDSITLTKFSSINKLFLYEYYLKIPKKYSDYFSSLPLAKKGSRFTVEDVARIELHQIINEEYSLINRVTQSRKNLPIFFNEKVIPNNLFVKGKYLKSIEDFQKELEQINTKHFPIGKYKNMQASAKIKSSQINSWWEDVRKALRRTRIIMFSELKKEAENNKVQFQALLRLSNFLNEFDYGNSITIQRTRGMKEPTFRFFFNRKNADRVTLDDYGYGTVQFLAILFEITNHIMNIAEQDRKRDITTAILIEEPESNCHPSMQERIAEILYSYCEDFKLKFILETHSEYMMRKVQLMVAKDQISNSDCLFYFLEKEKLPTLIALDENGILSEKFGKNFYDLSSRQYREHLKAIRDK